MKSAYLTLIAASLVLAGATTRASAADCSPEKILEIRGAAPEVVIDCRLNLDLSAQDTLTKRLRFIGSAASGSSLRCNGAVLNAKISVESRAVTSGGSLVKDSYGYQVWDPPTNIALDACRINGYVHVRKGPDYNVPEYLNVEAWRSSRDARPGSNHVARARASAPSNVRVTNSSIHTNGNAAAYIYSGVTGFQLLNSTVYGTAKSIAIYLDSESANALIKDNVISVEAPRELIAVDTSEGNRIINNRLENLLDNGGVFVYRNCGECHAPFEKFINDRKVCDVGTGNVRHTQPSHNEIINNVYTTGGNNGARKPAIWIGSQGGGASYCDADSDAAFGSGVSDYDHAHHNVVMQNQIIVRSVASSIIDEPWPNAYHNFVSLNLTTDHTIDREAGCFLRTGFTTSFLESGQRAAVIEGKGASTCVIKACTDGIRTNVGSCNMNSVPFVATARNNNATASTVAKCPTGMEVVGVTAACDLEYGYVTSTELASVDPGKLQVLTPSDQVSDGLCSVGGTSQSKGEVQLRGGPSVKELKATCREHDSNGGDCQIRGTLFCVPVTSPVVPPPPPPPPKPPEGFLEYASNQEISGWARDPDLSGPIPVHIYIDGVFRADILANLERSDLGAHGFTWTPPRLSPGEHRVEVFAIGLDRDGRSDGYNPPLSWSPASYYEWDFVKPGNNGTVTCSRFCEGAQWGEVGGCVGAERTDTRERLDCFSYPGLLSGGHQLTCECERGFIKPGNNGTVSCGTFCDGAQWGPVGRCVGAERSDTGQRLSCQQVPGFLGGHQLTCQCVPKLVLL